MNIILLGHQGSTKRPQDEISYSVVGVGCTGVPLHVLTDLNVH